MTLIAPPAKNPALPAGHPFINVGSAAYWSASASLVNSSLARIMFIFDGGLSNANKDNTDLATLWCVRSGSGLNVK